MPEKKPEASICLNCHSSKIQRLKINKRNFFKCQVCKEINPLTFTQGGNIKTGKAKNGAIKHYTAGALIKHKGKILLQDRSFYPFGWAGIAGHINDGETPIKAVRREVKEEIGLKPRALKKVLTEERKGNACSRGVYVHEWHLYQASVTGKAKKSAEAMRMKWFAPKEIKKLKLEPVWRHFFRKLKII